MYSVRAINLFDKLIMWVIISFADTTEALDAQAYLLLYCGKGRVAADSDLDFRVVKNYYFVLYDIM